MRLPISRIDGRKPNASVQIKTPGYAPVFGWMKAASHVPSWVFTETLDSTTGSPAADAEPTAATRPAATDMAMKSRREVSLCFFGSCISSVMGCSSRGKWLRPGFCDSKVCDSQKPYGTERLVSSGIGGLLVRRPANFSNASKPGYEMVSAENMRRGKGSAFFLFQFGPAGVESIHELLRLLELGARVAKREVIAHDLRIFQGGAPGIHFPFGMGDARLDGCKLAGFGIGELLFGRRCRGFGRHGRTRAGRCRARFIFYISRTLPHMPLRKVGKTL